MTSARMPTCRATKRILRDWVPQPGVGPLQEAPHLHEQTCKMRRSAGIACSRELEANPRSGSSCLGITHHGISALHRRRTSRIRHLRREGLRRTLREKLAGTSLACPLVQQPSAQPSAVMILREAAFAAMHFRKGLWGWTPLLRKTLLALPTGGRCWALPRPRPPNLRRHGRFEQSA